MDAHFRCIGALDAEGFHPRYVSKFYGNFTILYEIDGIQMESHHDFWQRGILEYYIYIGKNYYGMKKTIGRGDARDKDRGKGRKKKYLTISTQHADDEFSDPFEDLESPVIIVPNTLPI